MFEIKCDTCGNKTMTRTGLDDPHSQLQCSCCPIDHNHAGLGCRTITITALGPIVMAPAEQES